tara:strand:+ start:145121 stop:145579 length:459 start_codon:yes stop_codon:yes gene_type:complete
MIFLKTKQVLAFLICIFTTNFLLSQTFSKVVIPCTGVPQEMNSILNDSIATDCSCFRFGAFVYGVEYSIYSNRLVTTLDVDNGKINTYTVTNRKELLKVIPETINDLEGLGGEVTKAYKQGETTIFEMMVYGEMRIVTRNDHNDKLEVQLLD